MTLLGIDIGTTALKAALFEHDGRQLASVREPYHSSHQDAGVWWRACVRAVRHLVARAPAEARASEALGLCGRGGTRVYLDESGRVLSVPAAAPKAEALARAAEMLGHAGGGHGRRFLAGLLQLHSDQPAEFAAVRRALFAKDYVLLRLTGHAFTDPVSSIDGAAWPESVLAAPELEAVQLPPIRPQWHTGGDLRPEAADEMGLRHGLPVAIGSHDGAAATVGAGAARPGAHCVTLGTNTVYRVIHDDAEMTANRFWAPLPGLMAYGADVTLGGYACDWVAGLAGATHDQLTEEAQALPPGSAGVVFLPQMAGRVLPRPLAGRAPPAAFVGLRGPSTRAHLYRAILEGNAFALRTAREVLLAQPLPDGDIHLTGGGATNPLWRQILADVFRRPVHWSGVEDGCRGAAIFAGVAAGAWPEVAAAVRAMTGDVEQCAPGRDAILYEDAYARFVRVREALDDA